MFEDDGEEILPPQAAQHVLAIWRDRAGIGVVNDHRLHRRIVGLRQRLAEPGHVDRARGVVAEVGPLHRRGIQRERAGGGELAATAGIIPGAGDRRQQ